VIRLSLGAVAAVVCVIAAVNAAGSPWAVPMAFAAAGFGALLVAADWRNAR
jgi:hypothetical protein